MAVPTFISIDPVAGPAGGRSIATIVGTNFRVAATNGKTVLVQVDGISVPFQKTAVISDTEIRIEVPPFSRKGSLALVDSLPPVDIRIANIDDSLVEIPGEVVIAVEAYTHQRVPIRPPQATENNRHYTQVIKEVLGHFHRQVLVNTSLRKSVDYGDLGEVTISDATLPSIGLVGPRMSENFNERHQWLDLPSEAQGLDPEIFHKRWHGYVIDIEFDVIIGTNRVAEMLSLTQGVVEMFLRTPYIEVPVVPGDVNGPKHQFPLVLVNAPNAKAVDRNSDLMITTGLFEIRRVPLRLTEAFQVNDEVLEGELQTAPLSDLNDFEITTFADSDP